MPAKKKEAEFDPTTPIDEWPKDKQRYGAAYEEAEDVKAETEVAEEADK